MPGAIRSTDSQQGVLLPDNRLAHQIITSETSLAAVNAPVEEMWAQLDETHHKWIGDGG